MTSGKTSLTDMAAFWNKYSAPNYIRQLGEKEKKILIHCTDVAALLFKLFQKLEWQQLIQFTL